MEEKTKEELQCDINDYLDLIGNYKKEFKEKKNQIEEMKNVIEKQSKEIDDLFDELNQLQAEYKGYQKAVNVLIGVKYDNV